MTRSWLRKRRHDPYHRRAREEGYRSRSAYKLLQISGRFNLIGRGDVVVDMGASPGGWIQASRRLVGDNGFILGVDLEDVEPFHWTNVETLVGDIMQLKAVDILDHLPHGPDVVLSDVSQNISGIWEVDHARQIHLAQRSLRLAENLLHEGGSFLVKAFQGELFIKLRKKIQADFKYTKVTKPKASRKRSAEVYVVAKGFHAQNRC